MIANVASRDTAASAAVDRVQRANAHYYEYENGGQMSGGGAVPMQQGVPMQGRASMPMQGGMPMNRGYGYGVTRFSEVRNQRGFVTETKPPGPTSEFHPS